MATQTHQVYKNIGNILESVDATFSNVVELTTLVVGRENLPAHLEVISELYQICFLIALTRKTQSRSSKDCKEKIYLGSKSACGLTLIELFEFI